MVLASVIIPAHSPAKLLRRVLQLIDDQSTDDYELIVVAGCREAIPLVRDLPLAHPCRLYDGGSRPGADSERHGRAWNLGAQVARGQWLFFLRDDCFVNRQHLESFAAVFQEDTLVFGPVDNVDVRDWTKVIATDRRTIFQRGAGRIADADTLLSDPASWTANMAVPRRAFVELGGIDEDLPGDQAEIDFCRRFAGQFRNLAVVPAAVRRVAQPVACTPVQTASNRTGAEAGRDGRSFVRNGGASRFFKNDSAHGSDLRSQAPASVHRLRNGEPAAVQEFGSRTARLLWSDEQVYEARLHRCAAALIALARTIEKNKSLQQLAGDFLDGFAAAVAADPAVFSQVWSEPLAYAWTQMAYELAENYLHDRPLTAMTSAYCTDLGAADARSALTIHLDRFKAFRLGIALLSGEHLVFPVPLSVQLPFSVPGTHWVVPGEGTANIEGTAAFTDADGPTISGTRPVQCPLAQHADYELRLQTAGFNLPGLAELQPVLPLSLQYQEQSVEVLSQALGIIAESQPTVFAQIKNHLRLLALKPDEMGNFGNVSYSQLPGAMVLSTTSSKWLLAEDMIHEFHHNRLFVLEDLGPFFPDGETAAPPGGGYYSPWRRDLRPLKGVFHAVYVFIAQLRYNLGVLSLGSCGPSEREFIQARIRRVAGQVTVGMKVLDGHGRYSPYGQQILTQLGKDLADLKRQAAQAGVTGDGPAMVVRDDGSFVPEASGISGEPVTVMQAIQEHMRQFDVRNHAAGVDILG